MKPYRKQMIADKLRLLATAVENCTTPSAMTGILLSMSLIQSLLNMSAFDYQKKLIEASKHDMDQNEIEEVHYKKAA